jgi:hypothetical protein
VAVIYYYIYYLVANNQVVNAYFPTSPPQLPFSFYTFIVFFELTTFKMTFRDRIVVREIDIRALRRGRRPF